MLHAYRIQLGGSLCMLGPVIAAYRIFPSAVSHLITVNTYLSAKMYIAC